MKTNKVEICFVGLLRNVDDTILNLKLEKGFEVASKSVRGMTSFLGRLEKAPAFYIGSSISVHHHCFNVEQQKCFFVKNSRIFKIHNEEEDLWKKIEGFRTTVSSYLLPTLRLMRLFSEGNIGVPLKYYYTTKPLELRCVGEEPEFPQTRVQHYSLDENKLPLLNDFLKNTPFPPFEKDYLQLAFENYEQSYNAPSNNLAFLFLINGLEALFNQGSYEVRFSLSRNCATLISKNGEHGESIFRELKKLYDLRCNLVHGTKKIAVSEKDVERAREYLRDSIKKLLSMNLKKQEILKILNAKGFGQMNCALALFFP